MQNYSFHALMHKLFLLFFMILLPFAVSVGQKPFVLPQWVTFPNKGEYIGLSRPCETPDIALHAAILSYVVCSGNIGNNPYWENTLSVVERQSGHEKIRFDHYSKILGSFDGQIHYDICRQEKLQNGEWVVSISEGQQYTEDVKFKYHSGCTSLIEENDGQKNSDYQLAVAVELKTSKATCQIMYTKEDDISIGGLDISYADVEKGRLISSSSVSSEVGNESFLPQSSSSEASFQKLQRKFFSEQLHKEWIEHNLQYNVQSNSASDVYLSNLLNLLGNELEIERKSALLLESAKDEDKAFLSLVSLKPLAKLDFGEDAFSDYYLNRYSDINNKYNINIPFHIDEFYMQNGNSGFVCSSDASEEDIRDAIIYSSREIFEEAVLDSVGRGLSKWARKGEFETSAQWQKRVTSARRDSLAETMIGDLTRKLIERYDAGLQEMTALSLGSYDADRQSFVVNDKIWGTFHVPVPLDEAKQFKANWEKYGKKYRFDMDYGKFYLDRIEISDDSGRTYVCDSQRINGLMDVVRNKQWSDFVR